jgi:hypothetical protein
MGAVPEPYSLRLDSQGGLSEVLRRMRVPVRRWDAARGSPWPLYSLRRPGLALRREPAVYEGRLWLIDFRYASLVS